MKTGGDGLRGHHANGHRDDGEEEEGEDNGSANFVLLGFEVVVMIVCHGSKIQPWISSSPSFAVQPARA